MVKFILICSVFLYVFSASLCSPLCKRNSLPCLKINPSVRRWQEYIRINTANSANLAISTEFWRKQARNLNLEFAVYRPSGLPICVLTWRGSKPNLKSIMLNTHVDVVPVYESLWTYPPFAAHIDEKGYLYGRGTQDTKTVGITYIEAIRRLIQSNVVLQRTIHLTVMPDEETGGYNGMIPFVKTKEFRSLNIAFALDEGFVSPDNTLFGTYVDRRRWSFNLTMFGEGGHALKIPSNTSISKLNKLINLTTKYRDEQRKIKNSKSPSDFGSYGSVNIDVIESGIQFNVIPSIVTANLDLRLPTNASVEETKAMVESWRQAVGNDTILTYIGRVEHVTQTPTSNPFWSAVADAVKDLGYDLKPIVFPAGSDILHVRNLGIPAMGFAPFRYMTNRFHDNDEYVPVDIFLEGIDIYVEVIKKLGNLVV